MRCARCAVEADEQIVELIGFQGDVLGLVHRDCLAHAIMTLCRENPVYIPVLWQVVQYEETHSPDSWAIDVSGGARDARWEAHQIGVAPRRLSLLADNNIATIIFKSNSSTNYSLVDRKTTKQVLERMEIARGQNLAVIQLSLSGELLKQAKHKAARANSSVIEWMEEAIVEKLERDS